MKLVLDEATKKEIDAFSQFEMCRLWRFSAVGSFPYGGEAGDYFVVRMKELGGFTPEISKRLGWER